jgi:hypothetical protein
MALIPPPGPSSLPAGIVIGDLPTDLRADRFEIGLAPRTPGTMYHGAATE